MSKKIINKTAGELLRMPDVVGSVGLSRSTIYRMMADKVFPPPKKQGKASIWWETQIKYFIEKQSWDEEKWMYWLDEQQKPA